MSSRQTGMKLILYVTDRGEQPAISAYDGAVGLMENVRFVRIPIAELGENVLYYQSVDGVLWMDADADTLDRHTRAWCVWPKKPIRAPRALSQA